MDNISILYPIISRVRRDVYAVKRIEKAPACIRKPFTDQHLEQHLSGQKIYGVYPIEAGSSKTSIALLDLDSHKGETSWTDMMQTARFISAELEKHDLITIPWRSSGGYGLHLYMIWDSPQDAYSVRELLCTLLENVGYKNGTGGVAAKEIEIFPKQSSVAEGKVGNMFILPLAGQSLPIDKIDWSIIDPEAAISLEWPSSKVVPLIQKPKQKQERQNKTHSVNLNKMAEILKFISCEDYDIWIKVGMALHYETNGSLEALHLWDKWSADGNNYVDYSDLEKRWDNFTHTTNTPATLHSLKKLATENGWIEDIINDFEDLDFEKNPAKIIQTMSELSAIEYDRLRKQMAKKLDIRMETLDDEVEAIRKKRLEADREAENSIITSLEPWPEKIDGILLLDEIHRTIGRFIVCDEKTKVAASLWITFTWFIDHVQVAPIAMITAPEKRCGKSQLLSLIDKLACRPLMASNITPAAVFRVIEDRRPTLLIDEADTFMDDKNSELGGIINSGHTRDTAYVIRVCGEEFEAKQFSTWGAKAIAGIGRRTETIEDRSINLRLRRKLPSEEIERLRHAEPNLFKNLSQKLCRFAHDHGVDIKHMRPNLPEELHDRAQDNWESLLSIADFVGGTWPERARKAALEISGSEHEPPSIATELLSDIQAIFEKEETAKIHTVDLIEMLCADDEKPWEHFKQDKKITSRQLATLLKAFGVRSKDVKIGGEVRKGYSLADFEDSFARYLPDLSAAPLHTLPEKETGVAGKKVSSATKNINATEDALKTADSSEIADEYSNLC